MCDFFYRYWFIFLIKDICKLLSSTEVCSTVELISQQSLLECSNQVVNKNGINHPELSENLFKMLLNVSSLAANPEIKETVSASIINLLSKMLWASIFRIIKMFLIPIHTGDHAIEHSQLQDEYVQWTTWPLPNARADLSKQSQRLFPISSYFQFFMLTRPGLLIHTVTVCSYVSLYACIRRAYFRCPVT